MKKIIFIAAMSLIFDGWRSFAKADVAVDEEPDYAYETKRLQLADIERDVKYDRESRSSPMFLKVSGDPDTAGLDLARTQMIDIYWTRRKSDVKNQVYMKYLEAARAYAIRYNQASIAFQHRSAEDLLIRPKKSGIKFSNLTVENQELSIPIALEKGTRVTVLLDDKNTCIGEVLRKNVPTEDQGDVMSTESSDLKINSKCKNLSGGSPVVLSAPVKTYQSAEFIKIKKSELPSKVLDFFNSKHELILYQLGNGCHADPKHNLPSGEVFYDIGGGGYLVHFLSGDKPPVGAQIAHLTSNSYDIFTSRNSSCNELEKIFNLDGSKYIAIRSEWTGEGFQGQAYSQTFAVENEKVLFTDH